MYEETSTPRPSPVFEGEALTFNWLSVTCTVPESAQLNGHYVIETAELGQEFYDLVTGQTGSIFPQPDWETQRVVALFDVWGLSYDCSERIVFRETAAAIVWGAEPYDHQGPCPVPTRCASSYTLAAIPRSVKPVAGAKPFVTRKSPASGK